MSDLLFGTTLLAFLFDAIVALFVCRALCSRDHIDSPAPNPRHDGKHRSLYY